MLIPRILGAAGVVAYLLAMCLPAVVAKGYQTAYLLHGWEVIYVCGLFSFAPSMGLDERAPFIVVTVSDCGLLGKLDPEGPILTDLSNPSGASARPS